VTIAPGIARAVRSLPRRALRGRLVRLADLRRFASAVRGPHRRSAVRAVVDGAIVVATLERRGLAPLLQGSSTLPEPDPAEVRPMVAAVDAGLGLLPVAPTCLRRSVTLLRELRRRGLGATMHIGVRKTENKVEAHAWVEVAGEVVNDDPDVVGTYVPLSTSEAEQFRSRFT
jgi:Transglutaminase-like superfamily